MGNIIYKWNDESTYTGGNPPKQYRKGDVIPLLIFPPNLLKQHIMYGRIIKCEPRQIPDVSLSISVMAHPQRANFFPRLREKLGEDIPFSIYFSLTHFTNSNYSGTDKIYALHHYGSTVQGTYEKGVE